MAGIGFALRDLLRKDTLWAIFEAQLHGVIAVAGPWFFTIVGMALPAILFHAEGDKPATDQFVTLVLYIFSASLTLTSPIAIGLTRHVSDCLYQRRDAEIAGSLVAAVGLCLLLGVPVVAFGARAVQAPAETKILAAIGYGLVTLNWIVAPMLSTLRQFRALTLTYAAGTAVFGVAMRSGGVATVPDLLIGFDVGMLVTNSAIIGLLLHGFPGQAWAGLDLVRALGNYWDLALGGLFYGAGIWADKWIMWAAPQHVVVANGLASYPTYDTVAFVAYVTTVPALALFIIEAETSFHEACQGLYGAIQNHSDYQTLQAARQRVMAAFRSAGRNVLLLQLFITTNVLLMPTLVLDAVGLPHSGVFMFRLCAMGAALQSAVLMLCIVLHYFDSRRTVLWINLLFLLANIGFTWACLQFGLPWYGFGYFVASLVTFAVAYVWVARAMRQLLYLAFVRQNAAVTQARAQATTTTQWLDATTKGFGTH